MSDSPQNPWSSDPNAPNITYIMYFDEKAGFIGYLIYWILYGIATMASFQCMAGLFDPVHRRGERIKWGLVSYTVVMFSLLTVITAMTFAIVSICYIYDRQFPGGPYGCLSYAISTTLGPIPDAMAIFSNWLADGLLLYRCYIIYAMDLWVIAFPCLMYLGSVAVGILLIHWTAEVGGNYLPPLVYLSISVSLNVLLTLMIVIRLILHIGNTRAALGMTGTGGLCKAIITMFIESCALYSASSLLVLGPMSAKTGGSHIMTFFIRVLPATQVIATLLVIQRTANRSTLTSNTIVSGRLSTFKARSRGGVMGTSGALPSEDPASSVGRPGVGSDEVGVGVETTIE